MSFMMRLEPTALQPRENFILAGQSNMSGRGSLAELPMFPYANKVKVYSNAGTWVNGAEPVDSPTGQIDTVSFDGAPGASPSLAFGNGLYQYRPFREFGLVPCARGGSALSEWASNASRSTLFGSMVARTLEANAQGVLKGIVWYQGETEAQTSGTNPAATNWSTNFLTMFDALCTAVSNPTLKCIVTELGPNPDGSTNWAGVQAQQRALDGQRSGRIKCVSAADLVGQAADPVHLTTASLVTLGARYAATMATLLST